MFPMCLILILVKNYHRKLEPIVTFKNFSSQKKNYTFSNVITNKQKTIKQPNKRTFLVDCVVICGSKIGPLCEWH